VSSHPDLFSVSHQSIATPAPEPVRVPPREDIVEHVTGRGRTLHGVVRREITADEAKAIDPYSFRKDGGWFIRSKHLGDGRSAPGPAKSDPATDTPAQAAKDVFATAEAVVKRRSEQAQKLRDAAETLGGKAQESFNRDRQANTQRRAGMKRAGWKVRLLQGPFLCR
jgi:hypothetical protein